MRISANARTLFTLAAAALCTTALFYPATSNAEAVMAADAPVEQRLPHISIVSVGRGAPVVLIPGLASPREVWGALVPQLAKSHRVILVQVNGFGGSDPGANLAPGVLDGINADLHSFLAAGHLGAVPVIGHSMGGLAALRLAIDHPGDVERLMIVDALPFFGALMDETASIDEVRPLAQTMQRKVAATYGQPSDRAAAEANVKLLSLKPENVATMVNWSLAADPRVTAELMFEDMTTDVRPQLAQLKAPTTLVYPFATAADQAKTLAFYQRQYAKAPGIAFDGVGGSAHMVMLDQPDRFAAAVTRFLARR